VTGPPGASPSVHLDALRGFAAFSVLLNHLRDALFVDYQAVARHNPFTSAAYLLSGLGRQWVIVFFVLSGYLVGGSVLRSVGSGKWSWRSYLLARLSRLYVVLLHALLLGGALEGVEDVPTAGKAQHGGEHEPEQNGGEEASHTATAPRLIRLRPPPENGRTDSLRRALF